MHKRILHKNNAIKMTEIYTVNEESRKKKPQWQKMSAGRAFELGALLSAGLLSATEPAPAASRKCLLSQASFRD